MNNLDYILELLEKEVLSDEEKQSLFKLLEQDIEIKDFYNSYNKIRLSLEKEGHISSDALCEYVLIKNGNKETYNAYKTEIPSLEKHLRECSKCYKEFLEFNQEYNSVDSFITEHIPPAEINIKHKKNISEKIEEYGTYETKKPGTSIFNLKTGFLRMAIMSILIIGTVYAGLYVISSYTVPYIEKYASLDSKTDFYITRGRVSPEFQQSVIAIQNRDYNSAINFLNDDIHLNNSDQTIFYTYYILGLTYLESAENNILGLFPSFNKEKVLLGIGNLKEAIKHNSSGSYPNINYDSYFFIGKANLMINNIAEAKKYLQLVVNNKGSKLEEAREILQRLNLK